jgi:hypothetical protein
VIFYLFSGTSAVNTEFKNTSFLPPAPNTGMNGFVVGAFNTGYDNNFRYISDTLGFNLWHIYNESESWGGRVYPVGWTTIGAPADTLFADNQGPYIGQVQGILNNVNSHNMQALMMRPKIEWLCFGQRSDYQCEDTNHIDTDLWFYAFNLHDVGSPYASDFYDNTVYGSNQWVRYLHGNPTDPNSAAGYVVRSLRANAEQCKSDGTFHGDSLCDWHIKPRIRIDSVVAHSPSNPLVCKIKVIAQDGSIVLKEVNIRASNFLDENFNYNGRYLEEFYHFSQDTNLTIHGAWGNWPLFSARGYDADNPNCNQADIQVYWYGNCDMWIDYVRVDNDVADQLFKGIYDNTWLQWEAHDIAANNCAASYNFYIELFEFNNIPCMKYVSRKLDQLVYQSCSKHISVMCMPIPFTYSGHVPWENRLTVQNIGHFKRNFIDSMGVQNFLYGFYPFNSSYHYPETYPYYTWTKVPNTLPDVSYKNGLLSKVVSPAEYDNWLQNYLDSVPYSFEQGFSNTFIRNPVQNDPGGFRYTMQFCDSVSKLADKPFIYNPQLHIWFCQCGASDTATSGISGEVQREPTNEELNLTANLAVSYGARGLMYFEYRSYGAIGNDNYSKGIVEPDYLPRRFNIYGQDKWDTIRAIVNRMKAWSPYVMSFNNADRHSYIYRTERGKLMWNSYFKDVVTYKPGTWQPSCEDMPEFDSPPNMIFDCEEDRYVQVATFKSTIPIEKDSKYFMIVNRRCSPFINDNNDDNHGGKRKICVVFYENHQEFEHSNNWVVTELCGFHMTPHTFDKHYASFIDLGEDFLPGEGRLYKIAPVPEVGGTLICDENITGQDFTCLDTVYNNGHNITIGSGTSIHFTDSSKIIMNGGTFQLGDPNYNGPCNVSIGAASGSHWTGFDFNNCNVKI